MEYSSISMVTPILKNIALSSLIYTDKTLLLLFNKYKAFQIFRYFVVSSCLFFFQVIPSLIPSSILSPKSSVTENRVPLFKFSDSGDSGIARALSQMLSIMNVIPVNSRKYEVVKSLAEKLIVDNVLEDCEALSEVNRNVLSTTFSRTLRQLEGIVAEKDQGGGGDSDSGESGTVVKYSGGYYGLDRVYSTVKYYGESWIKSGLIAKSGGGFSQSESSAEKLAAELLWLAEKMAGCGCGEEAVARWASASDLSLKALSAGPRLQGSLVKVSAYLFKQAREMGGPKCEDGKIEEYRKTKLKILLSWIPFLSRASSGLDMPALSISEKVEVEECWVISYNL